MLMQNFGVTNKEDYSLSVFWSGQFPNQTGPAPVPSSGKNITDVLETCVNNETNECFTRDRECISVFKYKVHAIMIKTTSFVFCN